MSRPEPVTSSDAARTLQDGVATPKPSNASELVRGTVLAGKYQLELVLGQGGMAVVWSAYHQELELPVAIKLLRTHDPRLAQRLRVEARAAARLVHPAIVRVLDVATTNDGDPFIVMELLTGETLANLVARERVSAIKVLQLLLPIIDGLALAHARGVIHRDLKPDNVFLAVEGEHLQPKLLDFGIARLHGSARSTTKLTGQGVALGCPSYMSPEQVRGEDVDFRSDIWSLCVLLYKVIGGRPPFGGADARATFDAILNREPAPLPLHAGVDGHLARIVLSGLSKEPAARPASMQKLGQQLARWLLLHGVSVDACGAPLVTQWLTGEPPLKDHDSAAPPTLRFGPPQQTPTPAERETPPSTSAAARTVPALPASARSPSRLAARRRRWVLWALAGTLIGGVSLAFTESNAPTAHAPTSPPTIVTAAAAVVAVGDADKTTSQPKPAVSPLDVPSAAGAGPAVTVPRAKGSPRTRRRALPF